MRKPERIDPIIERLRSLWHTNPDLRLGQIIVNAFGTADPFYVEDELFILSLEIANLGVPMRKS